MNGRRTKSTPAPLEPGILLWLERYVGEWAMHGRDYEVTRALDGWLVAREPDGKRVDYLGNILRRGTLVRSRAERDALLRGCDGGGDEVKTAAANVMEWLTPTEQQRRDIVGPGMYVALRRQWLARRRVIDSLEEEEHRERLGEWSRAQREEPVRRSRADLALIRKLRRLYTCPDPYPIPAGFVFRAVAHLESTGAPLIELRDADYHTVYSAFRCKDGFDLTVDLCKRPFETWRGYAAWSGMTVQELMDTRDLTMAALDRPVKPWHLGWSPTLPVCQQLSHLPRAFECADWGQLGGIAFHEFRYDDQLDGAAYATSELALSCLQYMLNDLALGIRIARPSEG